MQDYFLRKMDWRNPTPLPINLAFETKWRTVGALESQQEAKGLD